MLLRLGRVSSGPASGTATNPHRRGRCTFGASRRTRNVTRNRIVLAVVGVVLVVLPWVVG